MQINIHDQKQKLTEGLQWPWPEWSRGFSEEAETRVRFLLNSFDNPYRKGMSKPPLSKFQNSKKQ